MKGTLVKRNTGDWVVWWTDSTAKNGVRMLPLIDNGHIDGLKLYDSNEGLEVEFEIAANEGEPLGKGEQPYKQYAKLAKIITPEEDKMVTKCYCGHTTYCDCGPLEEAELKDWDVTLNDGLENEPYISDDFQIGPDGAYEHTEDWNTLPKEKAKELVDKFISYSYFSDGNNSMNRQYQQEDNAKHCALIAVDEILSMGIMAESGDWNMAKEFWEEVKKEIEKL